MKSLTIAAGILLTLGAIAWFTLGRGETRLSAAPPPPAQVMWLCLETGRLSEGPRPVSADEAPRVNPETGRPTLVQALYCAKCQGWRPRPPAAVRERMPGGPVCPKTRSPLFETAPPGAAREVAR